MCIPIWLDDIYYEVNTKKMELGHKDIQNLILNIFFIFLDFCINLKNYLLHLSKLKHCLNFYSCNVSLRKRAMTVGCSSVRTI